MSAGTPAGFTLAQIAVRFGLEIEGDPQTRVTHVASLAHGDAGSLSFLANPKLRKALLTTRAAAVVAARKDAHGAQVPLLVHDHPYLMYARIAALLHPRDVPPRGVHPSAQVAAGVAIPADASIGAFSIIENDVELGAGVEVGPHCIIERGVRIGDHSRILARVTICAHVRLGQRCIVHPGAVIGGEGFGFARAPPAWARVPQVGSVLIGDDVDVGCNTTIDRGAIGDTEIGDGVKLDNQIQIGHNVKIGEHTIMAACSGIAGSTVIGKRCVFGGLVGLAGHIVIGDDVTLTGRSMVVSSILEPGVYTSGFPAEPTRQWWRRVARLRQLSDDAPKKSNDRTEQA